MAPKALTSLSPFSADLYSPLSAAASSPTDRQVMHRRPSSVFLDTALRQLDGSRARKRPYLADLTPEADAVRIEHEGAACLPLAVSFCKSSRNSHLLAISDEEGYVSLCDTRRMSASTGRNGEYRIHDWLAHENTIFDVCWMKGDNLILSASGDRTIRIWDIESKTCTGIMAGHKGSVKSLCSHHSNKDLLVSGSRDGSFALWDLRSKPASINSSGEARYCSTAIVMDTHRRSSPEKRCRRGKVASTSITSVLYLKDDISIASATDADSVVKFWDSRYLKSCVTQTSPSFKPPVTAEKVSHGVSSLSQDSSGTFLTASCMDNRIYLYDVFHLHNGPVKSFSGCVIGSFYVKAAISPDATHILSGSSDKNAYIWQVDRPDTYPVKLEAHDGEVTAVDWCSSEVGKIATSSDDFTIQYWSMKSYSCLRSRFPITNRKRVTATPELELRNMIRNEPSPSPHKDHVSGNLKHVSSPKSPIRENLLQPATPESAKKRRSSCLQPHELLDYQKTPEPAMNSPSSVLNPPPSSKRTIRDYFLATS